MSATNGGKDDTTRPFQCETCQSRYTRQEHLDRHITAKHSSKKEFVCSTCNKAFARRDILKRHELAHEKRNESGEDSSDKAQTANRNGDKGKKRASSSEITYEGGVKVKQPRVAKACARCSKSKLRCDGQEPCARCDKAGLDCVYDRRMRPLRSSPDETGMYDDSQMSFDNMPSPATARNPYDLPVAVAGPGHLPVGNLPPYGPSPPGGFNMFSPAGIQMPPPQFVAQQPGYPYPAPYVAQVNERPDGHAYGLPPPAAATYAYPNVMPNAGPLTTQLPSMTALMAQQQQHDRPTSSHGVASGGAGRNNVTQHGGDFLDLLTAHGDEEAEMDWSILLVHTPRDPAGGPTNAPSPERVYADYPGPSDPSKESRAGGVRQQKVRIEVPEDHPSTSTATGSIDPSLAASETNGSFASASPASNIHDTAVASLLQLASHTPRHSPEPERHRNSHRHHAPADPWPLAYRPTQANEAFVAGNRSRAVSPDHIRDISRIRFEAALVPRITVDARDRIVAEVHNVSRDYAPFADAMRWVPPVEILDLFIQLYFERYHQHLPIIHVPTFDPNSAPPYLVLSIASTGARYAHDRLAGSSTYAFALLELARRMYQVMGDIDNRLLRTVPWHQATIIALVAGLSSGNKRDLERSQAFRAIAITFCRRQGWLREAEVDMNEEEQMYSLDERWTRWRDREEIKRLGFATILLDGMGTSMWELESLTIFLDATHATLPCHDALWEADSAQAWASMFRGKALPDPAPKMREAVAAICDRAAGDVETLRSSTRDQFAMSAIITVISLIGWLKQRETLTTTLFLPHASQWGDTFSTSPVFVALDAGLDYFQDRVLLPPEIQAMLPDSGGAANVLTLMLHHTAMTIRLPLRILQPLARTSVAPLSPCVSDALKAWVSDDYGRISRRTAFHAGQLFALARQGNGDGPLEAGSLFYATIALLTFVQECIRSSPAEQMNGTAVAPVIELDRFVDRNDQALVDWINNGSQAGRPALSRIGPLDDALTAEKMLRVAIEKLSSEKTWRIGELLAKQLAVKLAEEEQLRSVA